MGYAYDCVNLTGLLSRVPMTDRANITRLSIPPGDDTEWAERSEYWRTFQPVTRGRRKLIRHREPLIISGHGARIRVDRNTLLIRNGFTHYPQKLDEIRLFPGDPNLPDRIINLDGSGGISFDALNWMSAQKISLVQLNWRGQVTFSGHCGFAADPKLVQFQTAILGTKRALAINRKLIIAKFDNCIDTLTAIFPASPEATIAVQRIRHWKSELSNLAKSLSHDKILGYEGVAATAYHKPWRDLPLKWSGLSRKPIPRHWHQIGPRSMSWQRGANNARHPLNAMLNDLLPEIALDLR